MYVCLGLLTVENVPSPKSQFHAVGVVVLASVNPIVMGTVPEVRDAQKLTTGNFAVVLAVTVM